MTERISIFRVDKQIFLKTARTGEGARIAGGRWNPAGLPAIYCGQSLALSVLEILVHAATLAERSEPRVWFTITFPKDSVRTIRPASLPSGWADPYYVHPATVAAGEKWIRRNDALALRVPSALLPGEWNYILNPSHPHFRGMVRWSKSTSLKIDPRLAHDPASKATP